MTVAASLWEKYFRCIALLPRSLIPRLSIPDCVSQLWTERKSGKISTVILWEGSQGTRLVTLTATVVWL